MSQPIEPLTHYQSQTWLRRRQVLSSEQQAALAEHLTACAECRGYAATIRRLEQDLPPSLPERELSEVEIHRQVLALRTRHKDQRRKFRFSGAFQTAAFAGLFVGLLVLIYFAGSQLGLPFSPGFTAGGPMPTGVASLIEPVSQTATPLPATPPQDFQEIISTGPPTPQPSPTISPPPRVIVWPNLGPVNLRDGPGNDYAIVGTGEAGAEFQAVGSSQDGNWIQIEYPGAPGGLAWIYASFVQIGDGGLPVLESFPRATPYTVNSLPPVPVELLWSSSSSPDDQVQQGWLYFVVRPLDGLNPRQLARAPLDCLYQFSQCPVEVIPGWPEAGDYTLYWSPDGSQAAMADLNNSQLRFLEPATATWRVIDADFPATNDILLWSPDGTWIAATLQGADPNTSLVTLLSPDGSQVSPLAPGLGGFQMPVAWFDARTLLLEVHQVPPKGSNETPLPPRLYTVDVETGEWQEFQVQPAKVGKDGPVFSPDGRRFVLQMPVDSGGGLAVINRDDWQGLPVGMDGTTVAWSPDGQWLALARPVEGGQEVHAAHPDWKQVFSWPGSVSLLWMQDNIHLLVTGWGTMDVPTTLFLVDTQEGGVRQLALAGEGPAAELVFPSVQPPPNP